MTIIPLGSGKMSTFGGPDDTGVGPLEGLSCIDLSDLSQTWFARLFQVPLNSSQGAARNLNPQALYCAMRWAYGTFNGVSGEILSGYSRALIRSATFVVSANGIYIPVQAADWGPSPDTGRLIDLSPGSASLLRVQTDDIVSVSAVI